MKRLSAFSKVVVTVIIGLGNFLPVVRSATDFDGDFRLWAQLKLTQVKAGDIEVYTFGEARWGHDMSEFVTWYATQFLSYKASPGHTFQIGLTHLEARSREGAAWRETQRLELDWIPSTNLSDTHTLVLRNRLEFRWREGDTSKPDYVTRHRLYTRHKASWLPAMTGWESSNEAFYDWEAGKLIENRFYPMDMKFKTGSMRWGLFGMLRSRDLGEWETAYIMGFALIPPALYTVD